MKQPTIKELQEKIERLEARIRQLEASQTVTHNHYHYAPQPTYGPVYQPIVKPYTVPYEITCGGAQ